MFTDKTILITGGTGSWGNELTKQLLEMRPKKIYIFSRGEIAQVTMQRKFSDTRLVFIIGDVRDADAVNRVFQRGIDYVFHLAALKHVPICENEPWEAVRTNIGGISNVIDAVIQYNTVKKFTLVSTDKAVDPINVYGMTKGIAERMVIQANCRTKNTEFICIRGGNVLGTNGSLVPLIINQIKTKNEVTITDERMTRFFLTLEKAIRLLFFAVDEGIGGETYVMNMPSFYIKDLVEILVEYYGNSDTAIKVIGSREGEKIHETLISKHEMSRVRLVNDNYHVIYPAFDIDRTNFHVWDCIEFFVPVDGNRTFTSKDNLQNKEYLQNLLKEGGFLT